MGVGGITPATLLHIAEATDTELRIEATGSSSGDDARLALKTTNGSFVIQNDRSLGTSGNLTFAGNASNNIVIDHDTGRVGINSLLSGTQNTSNSRLSVFGNSSTATGSIPIGVACANVTSERYMIVFFNGNGAVGSIRTNGSSTSYNTSSDYRLKENVVGITDGIARVKQLQPKRFNFIADDDTTVDGFLAHEAQAVVPEAVSGTHNQVQVWDESEELPDGVSVGDNKLDEDGNTIPEYQGIDQSKLVPLLTAALQEAIAKIETLETKVAALEAG